ncbi:MAG: hypothetical protein JO189_21480 [Deltaproteobacteria bacterium]|nr:hypothetical protein [Deltaproteobacteria bacterium]
MKEMRCVALLFVIATVAIGYLRQDYIARGEQALKAENYRTAEIYFRKAIERAPHSDRSYYDLGIACLKRGDLTLSYMAFLRAAELNPGNVAARVEAGDLLFRADQAAKAEREARDASTIIRTPSLPDCCWERL